MGNLIATFNLGKVYNISSVFRQYPASGLYILDRDRNTSIVVDDYGRLLTEIPLSDAIDIIKQQCADVQNRRLLWPCLAVLEAIREVSFSNEEIVVMHYGVLRRHKMKVTKDDILAAVKGDQYNDFTILDTPMPFSEFQSGNKIALVQIHALNVYMRSDGSEFKDDELMFVGVFEWDGNNVRSLDGDTYNKDAVVYAYEWFHDDDGTLCLDIVTGEDW